MKAETTKILLPRTVYEANADKDIEFEATLPDYQPDINRVIRADAELFCEESTIADSKTEVHGKAVFTLLYESDGGKLRCEHFSADFNHKFDTGALPEGKLCPVSTARCSFVGCKTLNPRRFLLRCRADLGLCVKCMQSHDVISMEDTKDAFFKSEKLQVAEYKDTIRRDFNMEETFSLEAMPAIKEIISTSLRFLPAEKSCNNSSLLLRCEAVFKCLYEDEADTLNTVERRFPAVFTVEDPDINCDCLLSTKILPTKCEAEKQMDAYGEYRMIELEYSASVCIESITTRETSLPTDMFFENYVNGNKYTELPYEIPQKPTMHRFTEEKIFEAAEKLPDECLDVNAEVVINEAVAGEAGITLNGVCNVNIFGKREGTYSAKDCSLPFSRLIPMDSPADNSKIRAKAELISVTARSAGGSVTVRAEYETALEVCSMASAHVLCSADIEKRADNTDEGKPIIICYPQCGECAWDIAKRYYVNPEVLSKDNEDVFDKNGKVAEAGKLIII